MPFRICFVCSGNICRSPIAEVVFRELAARAGAADAVEVDSAGTGDWHVGQPADRRALRALARAGYDGSAHRARQFDPDWMAGRDLVVALDRGHQRALGGLAGGDGVPLLRSFDPAADGDLDVPDPYYGDDSDFRDVLRLVEDACAGLLEHVLEQQDGATAR